MGDEENTNDNSNEEESQGHPAWQEILSELPEELHGLIRPKLEEWDRGVQAKLQDLSKFDAYRPLVENEVPLEAIQQSLYLAQQFETNPEEVVRRAIEAFNLEQFQQQQPSGNSNEVADDEDEYEVDEDNPLAGLENHPAYKQLLEQHQQMQAYLAQQQEEEQADEAEAALEEYLNELHEEHGEFNDLYVTALMANGVDADEAIKGYQQMIQEGVSKVAQTTGTPPPVVMGQGGSAGSGLPEQDIKFGEMSNNQVNDLVEQMLKNAAQQG